MAETVDRSLAEAGTVAGEGQEPKKGQFVRPDPHADARHNALRVIDFRTAEEQEELEMVERFREDYYAAMITDRENKHVTFAALGNEVFPAIGPDGKVFPLHEPEYKDFLEENYPEKKAIQDHYVELLRCFTIPDKELDSPEYIQKYPNGMSMKEIGRIAQMERTEPEYQYLLGKLRRGVYKNTDFLMDIETDEKKEEKMKEALSDANNWYDEFIETVYGEDSSYFGLADEILFEDDVAKLILKSFNAKDARRRLEAKRKLLLAEETGRMKLKLGKGDHEMNRYTGMLNESGVYYSETDSRDPKEAKGLYTFYLVSRHPKKGDRRCTEAYFTKTPPENPDPDVKVKRMVLRCSEVEMPDENGKLVKKKIYYHQGDRRKTPFRMIQKGMIKDSKNPSQFTEDLNGKRGVYGDPEEMEAFRRHRKKCFWLKGCGIHEWDWEDSSRGREERKVARRPGQSGKLQFIKHTEEVTFPPVYEKSGSGKIIERREQFIYEHQDFDAVMFANYEYQIGVMHSQYEVGRVINGSLAELITPEAIYHHDSADLQFKRNMKIIEEQWSREDAEIWAEEYIQDARREVQEKSGDEEVQKWEVKFREKHHLPKPKAAPIEIEFEI